MAALCHLSARHLYLLSVYSARRWRTWDVWFSRSENGAREAPRLRTLLGLLMMSLNFDVCFSKPSSGYATALPGEEQVNRHAEQDDDQASNRISQVADERVVEQNGRRPDEQGRDKRITHRLVGSLFLWLALAKHEHCAGRDNIEKPFCENRE